MKLRRRPELSGDKPLRHSVRGTTLRANASAGLVVRGWGLDTAGHPGDAARRRHPWWPDVRGSPPHAPSWRPPGHPTRTFSPHRPVHHHTRQRGACETGYGAVDKRAGRGDSPRRACSFSSLLCGCLVVYPSLPSSLRRAKGVSDGVSRQNGRSSCSAAGTDAAAPSRDDSCVR